MSAHGTAHDPGSQIRDRGGSGDRDILKLGRYEVVRELGKGAMGIVYLAKDPLIGRLVALKTIRVAMHADDDEAKEFQQRFVREAQAAGILNHPSIVTVHDIGQDDTSGTSFIAMEYVEGQNLKEVLSQGRTLSFDQIGDIIAQVAEALDFAHSKGIVHRDVKPANVILIDGHRAKITDFGIAKIASGAANLTTTGQFLGTPNYMAPEQIKGTPVDGRTDIFSVGICLYECLTRRKPFGGDSLTSISYKIVHEPFPPLHEINPQIPEGYEEVVANCLAKDPSKRYQRARDLANALRAVIRGERPAARPPDPMLADETIVTRDKPTLEVPFPSAVEVTPDLGGSTRPSIAAAGAIAAAAAPAAKADAKPRAPREPVKQKFRRTLTNVRTLSLWRRRISPALFIAIVAVLVAGLLGAVTLVQLRQPKVPQSDPAQQSRIAEQRKLREEANALMKQGNTNGAYLKLQELQRIAPESPYVLATLQKLNAIRQQEEVSKQQAAAAETKLNEGLALLDQKKFDEAIVSLQQAFELNPNDERMGAALKRAQDAKQAALAARGGQRRATAATTAAPPASPAEPAAADAPAKPATFATVFINEHFTAGRLVVRVGTDIVANELLYTERKSGIFRRTTREPRAVAVANPFPPKNADVQIWVTVPDQQIQEHHVMDARRFESGREYRLVVRYDPASKSFSYEIN